MKKKWLYPVSYFLFFMIIFIGCSQSDTVAEVNDTEIKEDVLEKQMLLVDISYEFNGFNLPTDKEYKNLEQEILKDMAEDIILMDLAKDRGLSIDESVAKEQGESIIDSIIDIKGSQSNYEEFLKVEGQKKEDFEAYIMELARKKLYRIALFDEVTKGITVTEDEIEKYYQDNPLYYSNSTVSVMDFIFDSEDSAIETYDSLEGKDISIGELTQQVKEWKGLEQSQDLEDIYHADMPQDFSSVAFNTQEGTFSKPFATENHYHIIYTYSQDIQQPLPLVDIKDTVKKDLMDKKRQDKYSDYIINKKSNYQVTFFN